MLLIRFVFKIIVGALGALLGLTAIVTILLALLESDVQPLYLMTIAIIFGVPTWICYWLYKKISAADMAASEVVADALPERPTVKVRVAGREVIWELGEYTQSFIQRWIERAETIIELAMRYDIQADFRDDSSFYLEFHDTNQTLPEDALNLLPDEIDVSVDEYFEIVMQVEEYELNKYRPTYKYTAAISVEVFGDEKRYVNKALVNENGEATDIRTVQSVIKKYGAAKLQAREIISEYYADTKTDGRQDR